MTAKKEKEIGIAVTIELGDKRLTLTAQQFLELRNKIDQMLGKWYGTTLPTTTAVYYGCQTVPFVCEGQSGTLTLTTCGANEVDE